MPLLTYGYPVPTYQVPAAPERALVLGISIITALYVLLNLAIDIAYGLIDPRVRME